MSGDGFIHLRVRSAYSLSEGAIKIDKLVALAAKLQMPAVAISDRNNLFGALEFSQAATKLGVQPIIGCDLGIRREEEGGFGAAARTQSPDFLLLLVQDETGYRNLMHLVSAAWLDTPAGEPAQISMAALEGHTDGLIAISGGPGTALGRLAADSQADAARALAQRFATLFPGRFYVEIQRHGMDGERRAEPVLLDLAYALDLPLVATNDAHFADRGMYEAHDILLGIAEGAHVDDTNRRRLTPEHYFKSAEEMRSAFADLPEAVDNTLVIARRCAYMPEVRKPILPAYTKLAGRTEAQALRDLAEAGMARLRTEKHTADDIPKEKYNERLDYELAMIERMGFSGYFLIVADFIQWAKAHDIPVGPGRGSGAGSVVAWSLGITDLDPLRWGLLFERFLNPERVSMPDFDIDFCQDKRDQVINYVQKEYGADRVAQIITFGKLQARAVLRDVGRVLGMPYGQVDRICKLVPNNPAKPVTLAEAIDSEPLLKEQIEGDDQIKRLVDNALKLEGLYRHASTHAAGIVIGDRPLKELVALHRDPRSSMPATQFNMKYVEQAGLVKFDFLGLKTLTVLEQAVQLVRQRGIDLDLHKIPLDDARTFEMLTRGDSTGVFQLEGSGMRDILRKLKPNRFEDVIALVALYRPGPMDDIPKYIAVKNGEEEPDYLHPSLKPILEETFGVMVYQEQVMQIAQVLSGYSLGGADLLRRAMGKKIQSEMDAQRALFIEGAVERKVPPAQAAMIFERVNKFAGYGFNKCHSAPYAMVAYQTAFLKANYPVEFFAASMTLDMGNTDKLNVFRRELQRQDIPLLGPDINRSRDVFTVEMAPDGRPAVRYALAAVRNVGRVAMANLCAERDRNGPFKDLFDLAQRLDTQTLNKRMLESLIRTGALDGLNPNRAQSFQAVELLLKLAGAAAEERNSNQNSLFGDAASAPKPKLPAVRDWGSMEKLQNEFEAMGFYFSSHPLESFGKSLGRLGVVKAAELGALIAARGETRVRLAGTVIDRQERTSARGNRFAFVQFSDQSGTFEVMIFSELLSSRRDMLQAGTAVLVTADARLDGDQVKLTGQAIDDLDKALSNTAAGLRVALKDAEAVRPLHELIADLKGRGRITLALELEDQEVEMALPGGFNVPPSVRQKLADLPGVAAVEEI
ncbi:MAG: DNA polymerase III subunit alpha [Reyranellaceae bacterium]